MKEWNMLMQEEQTSTKRLAVMVKAIEEQATFKFPRKRRKTDCMMELGIC